MTLTAAAPTANADVIGTFGANADVQGTPP
jgi:hypothetical protein